MIYSMLGSVRVMALVNRLARLFHLPVVPHFMDDWPTTLFTRGELLGLGRHAVQSSIAKVLRHSRMGLCISEEMAVEYEQRYGIPFAAFMNCVPESAFEAYQARPEGQPEGELEFVYVGGLHLGRWASLVQLGRILERLRPPLPPARLTVYAPDRDLARHTDAFRGLACVRLAHSVASEAVPIVLQSADVVVHVESFDPDFARYTRLSLSTKLPQYLAAGRPVLGFGPGGLASLRYLASTGAASVVGENDPDLLLRTVEQLCGDPLLRQRLAETGYAHARAHHSKRDVAERFRAHLAAAAVALPVSLLADRGDGRSAGTVLGARP
ncbi:hypothetical protein [Micromonospora sp. NPDC047740]|uniref:glycosyltransferase family protein n=1 Tax=Micromonospora sp. NPDC047740 TaxID=3364254 RepID=UPI00371C08FB